jgi:uncharacterized protein (DUF952 family)
MGGVIYHIARVVDWVAGVEAGAYTVSTRGRTLAEEGFLHASTAAQVAGVANAFYAGAGDLVVLAIDEGLLSAQVRYEEVPGAAEPYPHIYGPLNPDAVVATYPLEAGADGRFEFAP